MASFPSPYFRKTWLLEQPLKDGARIQDISLWMSILFGASFILVNGFGRVESVAAHQYEYFRFFQPIAKAGYSMFIYHITLEDANSFRKRFNLPLLGDESVAQSESNKVNI
jgi:hypothetical protein